jgi:ABC-2 type transport system ATP-binding protein
MFKVLKGRLFGGASHYGSFFALNDINIEVLRGEKIGIIGNNGSGKTTLLKVISGIYPPNKGDVYRKGDVTLLTGLGMGMVDELSVEENVFLYGAIYGMDRKKIKEKFHEIIEWAELQNFVGAKVKNLSSGMKSRLAFSTTRYIETDIFLLDEALSAGDKTFREKCDDFFKKSKNNDTTFLIATHSLDFVRMFCNKTLWLHMNKQMAFGDTEMVLQQYEEFMTKDTVKN